MYNSKCTYITHFIKVLLQTMQQHFRKFGFWNVKKMLYLFFYFLQKTISCQFVKWIFLRALCQLHISGRHICQHICLNTPIWSRPKHDCLPSEIIHTSQGKNEGLTTQTHLKAGPSVCCAFMNWEFSQSSWQTALTTMKRPVKPTPAKKQKQHRTGCLSAFVSPRLRARDENGSVKQLVTCLSKKNVKRRPQKQIMASVVSTLTQFLALLRDRCAFGYAYSQSEAIIVSSLKNELHLTFKSQHELPFAIYFTDFNVKQDF